MRQAIPTVSKIVMGILQMNQYPDQGAGNCAIRLWCHECHRIL